MTDFVEQFTIRQFIGDGSTVQFAIPFYVPVSIITGAPALDIYVTPSGQSPIPANDIKTWQIDYTYTPNASPLTGGMLIFVLASTPPLNSVVTVSRNAPAELDVAFSDTRTFSGANLDSALQSLLIIEQQNKTFALRRNLSYIVNSYLPDPGFDAFTQIPILGLNQIWQGTGSGVVAVTLEENPDVSTLRSELANSQPSTDGARLIGYYNTFAAASQTVKQAIDYSIDLVSTLGANLVSQVVNADGALLVGYYDSITSTGKTVHAAMSEVKTLAAAVSSALSNYYQRQITESAAYTSTTATYTINTSPPTQSMGHDFYNVVITPKSATSLLKVTGYITFTVSATCTPGFWIARDSVANALKAVAQVATANNLFYIHFEYYMVSGTTSPITFKLFAGVDAAATLNVNLDFGTAGISGIMVEEFNQYTP